MQTPARPSQAQSAAQAAALRKARVTIWTGVAMIAASAVMVPLTTTRPTKMNDVITVGAVAVMGVGSGLVYWGFRQQRRAIQPSTTFAVAVGRRSGVVVRRSW